ncbi:MAG: hypothetical protein WCL08_04125 [Verrucomicrobiota bacterium]
MQRGQRREQQDGEESEGAFHGLFLAFLRGRNLSDLRITTDRDGIRHIGGHDVIELEVADVAEVVLEDALDPVGSDVREMETIDLRLAFEALESFRPAAPIGSPRVEAVEDAAPDLVILLQLRPVGIGADQ